MSGNESNADVYRSFGANPVVTTSDSITEHEQNMLNLNVRCRDHDDSIELNSDDENEDESFVSVKVDGTESSNDTDGEQEDDTSNDDTDTSDTTDGEETEFTPLGEPSDDLKSTISVLEEHEKGFEQVVNQAATAGLKPEVIERIQQEYNDNDELSEKSYEELEAVGYSREFVKSYIKGQEAIVNQYVSEIKAFAGGETQFDTLYAHLEANDEDAANSLINAIQNRDLGTIKTIINLAQKSRAQKYGVPETRSVAAPAKQAAPEPKKQVGFANQQEMIKAMSDPRYGTDANYRREVELKTYYSQF